MPKQNKAITKATPTAVNPVKITALSEANLSITKPIFMLVWLMSKPIPPGKSANKSITEYPTKATAQNKRAKVAVKRTGTIIMPENPAEI